MSVGNHAERGTDGRYLKDQNGPLGNCENTAQKIAADFKVVSDQNDHLAKPTTKTVLIGEAYKAQRKTKGAPEGNKNAKKQCLQNEGIKKRSRGTAEAIAKHSSVSTIYVERAVRFAKGLNEAEKEKYRNPQTKGGISMGKVSDEKIILALIATPTIREAAIMCGCSESTIYARLREPEFKARYDVERRGLLERNAAALQSHLGKAIATMAEIVDSKSVSPQVRLNAADAIVRNSLKLNEQTEIIRRVDELEAVVGALEERKR